MIYDEPSKLAGSVDMLFKDQDGLHIYDWKRCKEITKTNSFCKTATNPLIEELPDTNYWHYCLQLNTYKYIIEKNYGYKVNDLYLVALHPDNENYKKIKVVNLQPQVEALVAERKANL
jgi:ATP-dependent exoDNAse (exonuclease V) beta subunit